MRVDAREQQVVFQQALALPQLLLADHAGAVVAIEPGEGLVEQGGLVAPGDGRLGQLLAGRQAAELAQHQLHPAHNQVGQHRDEQHGRAEHENREAHELPVLRRELLLDQAGAHAVLQARLAAEGALVHKDHVVLAHAALEDHVAVLQRAAVIIRVLLGQDRLNGLFQPVRAHGGQQHGQRGAVGIVDHPGDAQVRKHALLLLEAGHMIKGMRIAAAHHFLQRQGFRKRGQRAHVGIVAEHPVGDRIEDVGVVSGAVDHPHHRLDQVALQRNAVGGGEVVRVKQRPGQLVAQLLMGVDVKPHAVDFAQAAAELRGHAVQLQLQLLDQLVRNRVGVQAVALLAEQNHHAQQDGQYGQHQPPGQRQAAGVERMVFHGLAFLLRYFSGVMS